MEANLTKQILEILEDPYAKAQLDLTLWQANNKELGSAHMAAVLNTFLLKFLRVHSEDHQRGKLVAALNKQARRILLDDDKGEAQDSPEVDKILN